MSKKIHKDSLWLRIFKVSVVVIFSLIALGGAIGAFIHYYRHLTSK